MKFVNWMSRLTDKDRKALIRLRLSNLRFPAKITQVRIVDIQQGCFSAAIYTKEYAPESHNLLLNKLWINEFAYIIKEGILLTREIAPLKSQK